MKAWLAHRHVLAAAALALSAASVGIIPRILGAEGDAIVLEPAAGREGQAQSLPRGEVTLLQVLKSLADGTDRTVIWTPSDPPDTRIALPRTVPAELKAVSEVLEQAGYATRVDDWKGKPAYRVERTPRKKGKILRDGERKAGAGESGATASGASQGGGGEIHLYAREEGAGRRFMVIFETDTREAAEEAISLLRAHQRSRTEARKKK